MPQISELLRRSLSRAVQRAIKPAVQQVVQQATRRFQGQQGSSRADEQPRPAAASNYPGDYEGLPRILYAPHTSAMPDPGEVAWGWVPYEEDHSQGKDRPVLIIGQDGPWLLGLPLSSVDHDRDRAQEASQGRYWVTIGSGAWDSKGRKSQVRVDRIVRFDPDGMRRVGGELDKERFDAVARGLREHWNQ